MWMRDRSTIEARTTWWLLGLGAFLVAGCECGAPTERERTSVETAPPPIEIPADDVLRGMDEPTLSSLPAQCIEDEECRAYRPAAWDARIECCYEYECDLDWRPIHEDQWAFLRTWRRANPFDCAEEMRSGGPCRDDVMCPLSPDPPPALCRDGTCVVEWPEPWPELEPERQSCSVSGDCVVMARGAISLEERCCDRPCEERGWVVLREEGARAIEDWLANAAPSCAEVQTTREECEAPRRCSEDAPPASCRAGFCALEGE